MRRHMKPLTLALVLLGLLIVIAISPVGEWLALGVGWVEQHPRLSWLAFIATYIVAAVLVVPGSVLTLGAGFVFGLPLGVLLVSIGSVLGAAAAFLVGRFFARDWVAERVARLPRFRALDSATRHEGFVIVFLARLSPLFPFNLLNYGLGLTGVRFRDYFFATWLGMLPATILYVYVGTLAKDLTDLTNGGIEQGPLGTALWIAGFAATVLLTVLITRKANRTLAAHLARESGEGERT
ncbi:MAG: TVP38/TMEM64 family protein [Gammaproteobacteria bacterium]|nr:TVP38/TMEM64 family protein [Gammaproteobacteria bacterium]